MATPSPLSGPITPVLIEAVDSGWLPRMKSLLATGVSVDERGPQGATALMHAAYHGNAEQILCLLAAGADPTAVDNDRMSAIHWLLAGRSATCDVECLDLLLVAGAPVDMPDATHRTPLALALEEAIASGQSTGVPLQALAAVIVSLLAHGASLESPDQHGRSLRQVLSEHRNQIGAQVYAWLEERELEAMTPEVTSLVWRPPSRI